MNQKFMCLEGKVLLRKESLRVKDIPLRKLPLEAAYGGMLSRVENEWARFNSFSVYGWRFAVACPAGTHFLPVSPTLEDVCLLSLIGQFLHVFDRLGRWFFLLYLGYSPGFNLICTDGQFLRLFIRAGLPPR